MTNERDNPGDAAVSATYRELADERAPASLNESILRDARAHAGRGYPGSMRWLRPMAWAATVGLSLAIVVQLTTLEEPQLDGAPSVSSDVPSAASPAEAETDASRDDAAAERLEVPGGAADASAPQSAAPERSALPAASPEAGAGADAFADSSVFDADNVQALDEAREMARQRSGPVEQTGRAIAPAAATLESKAASAACDESSRRTPEDWQACIDGLRRQGRDAEAAEEAEQLAAAFPEFVVQ